MAKFENLSKDMSKSYGPLAYILPLHLPYLRDQVRYKYYQSRTTNIKVIEQNAFKFFENLPKHVTPRVIDIWSLFRYALLTQSLSMYTQIFSFLAFIIPEKSVTKIFKNGKILKPIEGNVQELWALVIILTLHLPYLTDQV